MSDTKEHPQIHDQTLVYRNPEIIFTQIDGETVMMDAEFENYFGMASVATRIWDSLEEEVSFGKLCENMMREFEVEDEQCRKDVLKFLEKLREKGLLLVRDSGS